MNEALDKLKSDFAFYRWGVVALLIALAIGGTFVMLTQAFVADARKAHAAAQGELNGARQNLSAAENDRENMATYTEEYAMLLRRNVIGNEQRLDWIDGLEDLRRRAIVLGFKYNIAPEQAYKPPIPVDSGNFALNMSGMTLSLDLLHEGQLIRFFDALHTSVRGWYLLDGCTIERVPATATPAAVTVTPQLKAQCHGEWLTLKNRSAP